MENLNNYRTIKYSRLLYEAIRPYFALNAAGNLSILYKFLYGVVSPLQGRFEDFNTLREKETLIANCKWIIGQVTNVLNHLYDPEQKRIHIGQNSLNIIADPIFQYAPIHYDSDFESAPVAGVEEVTFEDKASGSGTIIWVPTDVADIYLSDLTATVAQIAIAGLPYKIETF